MRDIRWKRILIIVWACMLVFGLVYQTEVAEASHGVCTESCEIGCGEGNCGASGTMGCSCWFVCNDGTTGRTICML